MRIAPSRGARSGSPSSAFRSPRAPALPLVTPRPTEGRLATRDGKVVDVPLEHTEVAIRVDGHLAEATVTQRFDNPYARRSRPSTCSRCRPARRWRADDHRRRADDPRARSRSARRRSGPTWRRASKGLVAALLTQERPNLFTQSVANLEPAATIEVTLRYVQRLAYEDGGYELVFPMVAGPRYIPPANMEGGTARSR